MCEFLSFFRTLRHTGPTIIDCLAIIDAHFPETQKQYHSLCDIKYSRLVSVSLVLMLTGIVTSRRPLIDEYKYMGSN